MHWLRMILMAGALASTILSGGIAMAEALTGEDLAFQQLPLNGGLAPSAGGAEYPGTGSLSTIDAGGLLGLSYSGTYVSDDFSLSTTDPIAHVEWWGSYLNPGNGGGVQRFMIALQTDVPAADGNPAHPGATILGQIVELGALAPQSGTFTETAIPSASGQLYHYSAELALPFLHTSDAIYWLSIVALVSPTSQGDIEWAWQNRDYSIEDTVAGAPGDHTVANGLGLDMYQFGEDAMTGGMSAFEIIGSPVILPTLDGYSALNYASGNGPTGISSYGQDMAFALYTQAPAVVPEPSAWILLGTGSVGLIGLVRRRRRG